MAFVTFYGAVEGVTGSCYLVTTEHSKVLLDCGLFQGRREEEQANREALPFPIDTLDAVVISHAHLDHSGRLPLLVKQGYSGDIIMTRATCALIEILLKDAASLQIRDAEWRNKRARRAGEEEITPLYDLDDVAATLDHCTGVEYHKRTALTDDVSVRFLDAGHILGSAIVELYIDESGKEKKLVFSGDLGNSCAALLRDPEPATTADLVMLESTYGDREHRPMAETLDEFETILRTASANGGNILIPSFAVGRTQEIIFRLGELYQRDLLPHLAVYLDSPMAISVTSVYDRYQHVYNSDDNATITADTPHAHLKDFLPTLRYTTSTEESMALNSVEAGAIIIAGSGMCNGGRIRHHLKHNLWRSKSHVIFVGYQAIGTPGRALVDGASHFRFAGENIIVRASIHTLGGFSAHASQSQLLAWLGTFNSKAPLYLVHGEDDAKRALKQAATQHGWNTRIARRDETVEF